MRMMNLIGNVMAVAGLLTLLGLNFAGFDTNIWNAAGVWPTNYISGPR